MAIYENAVPRRLHCLNTDIGNDRVATFTNGMLRFHVVACREAIKEQLSSAALSLLLLTNLQLSLVTPIASDHATIPAATVLHRATQCFAVYMNNAEGLLKPE